MWQKNTSSKYVRSWNLRSRLYLLSCFYAAILMIDFEDLILIFYIWLPNNRGHHEKQPILNNILPLLIGLWPRKPRLSYTGALVWSTLLYLDPITIMCWRNSSTNYHQQLKHRKNTHTQHTFTFTPPLVVLDQPCTAIHLGCSLSYSAPTFGSDGKWYLGSTSMEGVEVKAESTKWFFRFEQQMIEELWAQRDFAALASNFGKKEAQRMFPQMFSVNSLPLMVASSSTWWWRREIRLLCWHWG